MARVLASQYAPLTSTASYLLVNQVLLSGELDTKRLWCVLVSLTTLGDRAVGLRSCMRAVTVLAV